MFSQDCSTSWRRSSETHIPPRQNAILAQKESKEDSQTLRPNQLQIGEINFRALQLNCSMVLGCCVLHEIHATVHTGDLSWPKQDVGEGLRAEELATQKIRFMAWGSLKSPSWELRWFFRCEKRWRFSKDVSQSSASHPDLARHIGVSQRQDRSSAFTTRQAAGNFAQLIQDGHTRDCAVVTCTTLSCLQIKQQHRPPLLLAQLVGVRCLFWWCAVLCLRPRPDGLCQI